MWMALALGLALSLNLLYQLDDLLLGLYGRARGPRRLRWIDLHASHPRRLALLIPFWKKERAQELAALGLLADEVFLGVHAGDPGSWQAARDQAATIVVHPEGATRNEAIRHLARTVLGAEKEGLRFDGFVLLEGSDSLHPLALSLFDRELNEADLVQLPLQLRPTPWREWAASAYGDEQADLTVELQARAAAGAALPTRGTGLAFSRDLLHALLERGTDLTAGYALGLEADRLGFPSSFAFATVEGAAGAELISVRRDAPATARWAIRRRTGQAAESGNGLRFGWGRGWRNTYFLWRDRRGFVFALAGLATSLLALAASFGPPVEHLPHLIGALALLNFALLARRIWLRTRRTAIVQGWRQAALVPVRWPVGNFLSAVAHWTALARSWPGAQGAAFPVSAARAAAAEPRRR